MAPTAEPCDRPARDLADAPGFDGLNEAAALIKKRSFKEAKTALKNHLGKAKPATEELIVAHALLGRASKGSGDATGADAAYDTVKKLYASPAEVVAKIVAPDDETRNQIIAKVVLAVGEAVYHSAEKKGARDEQQTANVQRER